MKRDKIILNIIILSIIVLIFSGCGTPTTPNIPDQGGGVNHNPIISDLSVSPRTAFINQNITITCTASDQDGDTLTYSWSSSPVGTINGSGSTITWKSPVTKGTYTITCTVSDGKGGEVKKSVDIAVAVNGVKDQISWSEAESNGWANPLGEGKELFTSATCDYDSGIYLYNWGKKHMGIDIGSGENDYFYSKEDDDVYPIAGGTIRTIVRGSDPMERVVIIEHTNSNNENFFAIYGHILATKDLEEDDEVEVGKEIGIIKTAGSGPHLHFGINTSSKLTDFMFTNPDGEEWGWGRIPSSANPSYYDWFNPIDYLNTHKSVYNLPLSTGRIAFTSQRDGNAEIYIMNADGSNQTNLTNSSSNDGEPCFSPDGQKITFESTRDVNSEVYVMDADGANQTNLTNNLSWDCFPSWGL